MSIFEITHPFHPLRGKQFVLATRRQTWGEDRVNYFDQQGKLHSMLASWTSVAEKDYFLEASGERSWFHINDLPLILQPFFRHEEEKHFFV